MPARAKKKTTPDPTCCPKCGRPYNAPQQATVKICRKCKKPIRGGKGGEKWHLVTEGGVTHLQHWNCNDPRSYGNKYAK